MKLIPVILSGGSGSRLWPVSREMQPKPFIRLQDGQSFLQKAFLRAAAQQNVAEILTVTNREFYFKTQDDFKELKLDTPHSLILEPYGKNTAAAIALAAHYVVRQHGEDAFCLVLTADHLIDNLSAFKSAVDSACRVAEQEYLVTFGIKPHCAETGYGYIQINTQANLLETETSSTTFSVKRFVEKPNLKTAEQYLEQGDFFWNAGMFCFKANTLLANMQLHTPEIHIPVKEAFTRSTLLSDQKQHRLEVDETAFAAVPSISIDYALMEKSDNVAVVTCDIGWKDIGAWDAMSELTEPDDQGNRITGTAMLVNSNNCFVHSDDRLVALVGLENTLVVDTADALLIAAKSSAQDVKTVYAQLKATGNPLYQTHKTVRRPWGSYTVLHEGPRFKIKSIVVLPEQRLSLQLHHHRSEHWIVVAGIAKVTNNGETYYVNTNESTYIPAGNQHRLENPGLMNLEIIEVQCGEYVGEDDIVRLEDSYGRVK